MVEFKLTINDPKTGKSYKKVIGGSLFKNKKIGEKINGDDFGFKGYEFEITGGSDNTGFPMRKDLVGGLRRKALLSKGTGMKNNKKGLRLRKTICGNVINANISQVNLKIKKYGRKKMEETLETKNEEEEKSTEEDAEEKKEEDTEEEKEEEKEEDTEEEKEEEEKEDTEEEEKKEE